VAGTRPRILSSRSGRCGKRAQRGPEAVARLIWRVDTLKVLQPVRPNAQIEQFDQESFEIPVAEQAQFAELFGETIYETAKAFFREMLASIRPSD